MDLMDNAKRVAHMPTERLAPLVPVDNQESYTHPTVAEVASPFLSSLSDAKSKLQPTSKIARKCTMRR